ncbi:MAG: endonuclease/exonuclease/phosphatase family protein [Verrucomicrobia bacterium]|jgi:endonuclease/exonuclease/phosphatase family metal-dependent hydrolase|nr:endonuclease/exonuclease/phosphatase family protein [Verrucomicrobiota bacterium]
MQLRFANPFTTVLSLLALFVAGGFSLSSNLQAADRNAPVKVMSFNIRYGAANDGENSWKFRDYLVIETIENYNPDLIGYQEALKFQVDYLKENLKGYGFHGIGRDAGTEKGEYVPLMWKTDRFEMVDSGHFWLSETPEIPGSISWDSSLTRMLSWVALRDLKSPNQKEFVFANTHFDHRGKEARLESAKLIRRRAEEIMDNYPIILTGDFNTTEVLAPYAALCKAEGFNGKPLIDSYRVINPEPNDQEASFSRWVGHRPGKRIDWILHTDDFVTLNAAINYTQEAGRFPSDHYPVEATVRLK